MEKIKRLVESTGIVPQASIVFSSEAAAFLSLEVCTLKSFFEIQEKKELFLDFPVFWGGRRRASLSVLLEGREFFKKAIPLRQESDRAPIYGGDNLWAVPIVRNCSDPEKGMEVFSISYFRVVVSP